MVPRGSVAAVGSPPASYAGWWFKPSSQREEGINAPKMA